MRIGKDLVAAAATPMVLGILSEGESYGYAILQRVSELSDGELEWSDGMLYPLLHRLEQARDLGRVVLKVAVHEDDDVPARGFQAGCQGGGLPEVAAELDDDDLGMALAELLQQGEAAVLAAVVNVNDLVRPPERDQHTLELPVELGNALDLVVDGNDDRQHQ